MRRHGRLQRLGLVLCALATSCSVIFIRPTPELDDDTKELQCRSSGWAAADAGAAIGIALLTAYASALAASTRGICDHCVRNSDDAIEIGLFAVAGTFAASAVYGLFANEYCNSVKVDQPGAGLTQLKQALPARRRLRASFR